MKQKNNWQKVKLEELIEIHHGYAFKSKNFTDIGEFIVLTPGNFNEKGGLELKENKEKYYKKQPDPDYVFKAGDIVVVMTDLIQSAPLLGGALIIPEDNRYLHNQRLGLVDIKESNKLDKSYLYYLFNSEYYRAQIRATATGATVRHTAPTRIKDASVWLPDISEQRNIAKVLANYDDLIENNLKRIKLLEEAAQLLYKEWFVDLRFPGHEDVEIIDGVPEGWEKATLNDVAGIEMGQSPKSEYYNESKDGLPFHQGVTDFGDRFPTTTTWCTVEKKLAPEGSILMSVRAPVGRLNISPEKIIIGRGLCAINDKSNTNSFLFYQLKSIFFEDNIIGGGTIFKAITKKELLNLKVLYPASNVLNSFNNAVETIDSQIEVLYKINGNLKQARDILLPRLMEGEVEV